MQLNSIDTYTKGGVDDGNTLSRDSGNKGGNSSERKGELHVFKKNGMEEKRL